PSPASEAQPGSAREAVSGTPAGRQIAIQRRTYPQRVLEAPVPICHESDTAEAEPSVDGVAEEYAVPPGTVDAPPTSVCPLSHPAPQGPIGWPPLRSTG